MPQSPQERSKWRALHKDDANKKQQNYRHLNRDRLNQKRRQYHHLNWDRLNKKRRQYRQLNQEKRYAQYVSNREAEFSAKGNFSTLTSDIPCNTEDYEVASTPESGVMNWYQCSEQWRLQWLLEEIQDLQALNSQFPSPAIDSKIEKLKQTLMQRIDNETVTPQRQHDVLDQFFTVIGRGCPWGQNQASYHNSTSIDAPLIGCACCGTRDYDEWDFNGSGYETKFTLHNVTPDLDILKMNQDESSQYEKQLQIKLLLPVNDNGTLRTFIPWKVRSVFSWRGNHYHLHPELVTNDTNCTSPKAYLCTECWESVKKQCVPQNSIASHVDFGLFTRIGLEPLSLREMHIISQVRHYYNIIKVESNTRVLQEHQHSAIKGCSILFDQDAPEVVTNLLSVESMNSNVLLHFVGHAGEFDHMYQRMMHSKSADVFGRSWVIYQWLSVLKVVNPYHENSILPSFFEFGKVFDTATATFMENSLETFNDDLMNTTDQKRDDIAGVRATTNPMMQASTYNEEGNDSLDGNDDNSKEFSLNHIYLTSRTRTTHNTSSDTQHDFVVNAANTLNVNVTDEKEQYNLRKSYRSEMPIDEFGRGDYALVGAFPHIFMLGCAYPKQVNNLSQKDCIHLLLQFSAVPSSCSMLIFYLFDIRRRHSNIRGMATKRNADPKAFENWSKEIMSASFQTKIQNAVADPDSKDAKYVVQKLYPMLKTTGKRTPLGPMEMASSTGENYALMRRFGPGSHFITINPDDVNDPLVFRLTFTQNNNNNEFPCVMPSNVLTAIQNGKPFAMGNVAIPTNWSALARKTTANPVAAAVVYKHLIYSIVRILIGLNPTKLSGTSKHLSWKKSPTYTPESINTKGGIIGGHALALNGVHENTSKKSIHTHFILYSLIGPALLQGVAEMADVCKSITEALDSMLRASVPRPFHVKYLVQKELPFYNTTTECKFVSSVLPSGRNKFIPPDPVTHPHEFQTFIHTTITCNGMHSHDKGTTGRCHKPPIGITRCSLSKPSGIVPCTRPVQLKDVTPEETTASRKLTITYTVSTDIQSRQSALNELPPNQQLQYPFPQRDPRLIVYEPSRPTIDPLPPQENNMSTKEWITDQLVTAMTTNARKENEWEGSYVHINEIRELERHLLGMSDKDIRALYDTVSRNLGTHNGYVVDFNPSLTAAMRCHSNALLLGSFEQSKSACHYVSPYIKKDKAPLVESLNIIYEAMVHINKYPSRAEDKHTLSRKVQYMLTRISNKLGSLMEVGDTQAALCLLGMNVILSSELFTVCDVQAAINLIKNEQTANKLMTMQQETYDVDMSEASDIEDDGQNKAFLPDHHSSATEEESFTKPTRRPWGSPLSLPKTLPASNCEEVDVDGDGNCFYHCMNILLYNTTSVDMCYDLRAQINQHLLDHLNDSMDDFIPCTVLDMMQNELNEMPGLNSALPLSNVEQQIAAYIAIMSNATPGQAPYCTYLGMSAFAHMSHTNLVVYVRDRTNANVYQQIMMTLASPEADTYCLSYVNNCHYRILYRLVQERYVSNNVASTNYEAEQDSKREEHQEEDEYYESDESDESWIIKDDECATDTNTNLFSKQHILEELLEQDEELKDACPNNATFQSIQRILQADLSANLDEPEWKFRSNAYGSAPLYRVDNDSRIAAIPYCFLYRYRGEKLKDLNRLEYYSTIQVKKDNDMDTKSSTPPHIQFKKGRKKSTRYAFDSGLEIHANHYQVMRSRQCTCKIFEQPPKHPGLPPEDVPENKQALLRWEKSANKMAMWYLTLFRPERNLYSKAQVNTYSYGWNAFIDFLDELQQNKYTNAISRFRLDSINNMMNNLLTSRRNRAIFSHYRARNATRWSEEEQYDNRQRYQHKLRKGVAYDDDSDMELDFNECIHFGLSDRKQQEIMNTVSWTTNIVNQLKHLTPHSESDNCISRDEEMSDNVSTTATTDKQNQSYTVHSTRYNAELANEVLHVFHEPMCTTESEHMGGEPMFCNDNATKEKSLEQKYTELVESRGLSADKLNVMTVVYNHFLHIRDGTNTHKSYVPPTLLVTGNPGTGKSWLIHSISDLATTVMDLDEPIKVSFMGIAAININGFTINSLFDIPVDLNLGLGDFRCVKPWDVDKLVGFKDKYNVTNISAIIIDEISMVKPWMLAYLDERMKEATQNYDKPFGGVALIMVGDFDQQPPIGGSSLPHLAMVLLEKEYQHKHHIYHTNESRKAKAEIESSLSKKGVQIFQQAMHLKLTEQYRCARDPVHMANLNKMNMGKTITPSDFELYKTLSLSDTKNKDQFLHSTIVVSGNYERQEINHYIAQLWAHYYKTHVVRWKRKIKYSKWKGMPRSEQELANAESQACFWEHFVPKAPSYIIYNLCTLNDLANGTPCVQDSLAFDSVEEKKHLDNMLLNTPIGGTITLPAPPTAINVELYADMPGDDDAKQQANLSQRNKWKHGSLVDDGRVVIPINKKTPRYQLESIRPGALPFHYNASNVPIGDHFPIELGFCITIAKAQGRTLQRLILSLSEHPQPFLRFKWEQVYTAISRVKAREFLTLLLYMGNRNTLAYLSDLKKDTYTASYFAGFVPVHPNRRGGESYWNREVAARDAGFTT